MNQLQDVATQRRFVLAGNAHVTLVSPRTGNRFTYVIRQRGGYWHVGVLVGPNNNTDYRRIGSISSFGLKFLPSSTGVHIDAWVYFWSKVSKGNSHKCEVYHEGRCGRCRRLLTTPESIGNGIGPECLSKMKRS